MHYVDYSKHVAHLVLSHFKQVFYEFKYNPSLHDVQKTIELQF